MSERVIEESNKTSFQYQYLKQQINQTFDQSPTLHDVLHFGVKHFLLKGGFKAWSQFVLFTSLPLKEIHKIERVCVP